jgi:hemoglobin-like flavoprotein
VCIYLYIRIFEIAPEVHGMFRFAREFEVGSEEMYQSERFMRHATGVISTVDTAVSMLAPDLDPLLEVLHDLGQRHADYGALPAHYAVVGRALIDTLAKALGSKFTAEIRTAWARIYDIISTSMIEGAEEACVDSDDEQ